MELIIKVLLLSAVCATVGLLVKKQNPEISILIVIATSAVVLFLAFGVMKDIFDFIKELSISAEIEPIVISAIIKSVGIGIVSKFASDVCKDAGQGAAASSVELLGSVAVVYIALPLIKTVVKNISSFI